MACWCPGQAARPSPTVELWRSCTSTRGSWTAGSGPRSGGVRVLRPPGQRRRATRVVQQVAWRGRHRLRHAAEVPRARRPGLHPPRRIRPAHMADCCSARSRVRSETATSR
jgi:hypothetical protein